VLAEALGWSLVSGRSDLSGRSNDEYPARSSFTGACRIIHHILLQHQALRDAVQTIAGRYALPPNWLNYLTQMLIYDKIIMPRGTLWKRYGPLHVHVPPKEYIFALKILAGRDKDIADCRILLPQTRIRTRKQAQRALDRYLLPDAQREEATTIQSALDVLFGSQSEREP
jgi:hypothetical protein